MPAPFETTLSGNGQATPTVKWCGPVTLSLSGTFGSGTATMQRRNNSGTWVALSNGAFTTATEFVFDFPAAAINEFRVDLTGSTTPTLLVSVWGQTTP
jgi:hypothetical protein